MSSVISNISVYIPHVFPNITEERIRRTFSTLCIGEVSRVDFVSKMDKYGKYYNVAYVHFDYWYNNSVASGFQQRVLNPEVEAKLVYDDPWFWVVLENKTKKHIVNGRKPRINLNDFAVLQVRAPLPECRDQEHYYQEYYIPDYDNEIKNTKKFHNRAYVENKLKELNRSLVDLVDNDNYPSTTRQYRRAAILGETISHYKYWINQSIPRINIDDEMEQILDEMYEVDTQQFLDEMNEAREQAVDLEKQTDKKDEKNRQIEEHLLQLDQIV
jgi:hypothetical protein